MPDCTAPHSLSLPRSWLLSLSEKASIPRHPSWPRCPSSDTPIPSPQRSSSQDQLSKQNRKKKSLTISKTKKVSRRMAKLLKGQKSVVLPHYQQSSSFLLTPNHFSFFPPFLFFSFPPPFFSRDSFIRLLILAYQV